MLATWSRSSRAPPRVRGVTPRSGVVIVGVGPPLYIGRLQRPLRRAGATRSRPEVVPLSCVSSNGTSVFDLPVPA